MKGIVTVSDLHVGSYAGLVAGKMRVEGGGGYVGSKYQNELYKCWKDFFYDFVPGITGGAKKKTLVLNGDSIDGNHHNAVSLIPSTAAQAAACQEILEPIVKRFDEVIGVYGTEVHDGKSGQDVDALFRAIKCTPDSDTGNPGFWQYWVNSEGVIFQFAHHIETTRSSAYESSAPMREMVAGLIEASQWGLSMPHVFVRSHRHRYIPVSIPSKKGRIRLIVTPGWQLKNPYSERIDRMRMPHIGGVVFKTEAGICQDIEKIYPMKSPKINQQ